MGLNGLDLFDISGHQIIPDRFSSNTDSTDHYPLHNGVYIEGGEEDMWKAALHPHRPTTVIEIDLKRQYIISMVRLWNYWTGKNSWKVGARHVTIEIDGQAVFCGELPACTGPRLSNSRYEQILFTESEEIFKELTRLDWLVPFIEKEENAIDEIALKELKTGGMSVRIDPGLSARDRGDLSHNKSSARKYAPLTERNTHESERRQKPLRSTREVLDESFRPEKKAKKVCIRLLSIHGDPKDMAQIKLKALDKKCKEIPFFNKLVDSEAVERSGKKSFGLWVVNFELEKSRCYELYFPQVSGQELSFLSIHDTNLTRSHRFIRSLEIELQDKKFILDEGALDSSRLLRGQTEPQVGGPAPHRPGQPLASQTPNRLCGLARDALDLFSSMLSSV